MGRMGYRQIQKCLWWPEQICAHRYISYKYLKKCVWLSSENLGHVSSHSPVVEHILSDGFLSWTRILSFWGLFWGLLDSGLIVFASVSDSHFLYACMQYADPALGFPLIAALDPGCFLSSDPDPGRHYISRIYSESTVRWCSFRSTSVGLPSQMCCKKQII